MSEQILQIDVAGEPWKPMAQVLKQIYVSAAGTLDDKSEAQIRAIMDRAKSVKADVATKLCAHLIYATCLCVLIERGLEPDPRRKQAQERFPA